MELLCICSSSSARGGNIMSVPPAPAVSARDLFTFELHAEPFLISARRA